MSIDEFKRMSSPEDHQGYRIVEIKTVSKTYNEFIPVKDRYGRISCDRDGNYIPMKDANGNNILTGEKIIKVQINAHTHIQAEELLLFAKRNKNNTRATHLGHITLGRLEKLRAGSDLRGTNCVRLSWLRTDPEELIDEIKSRCRTYLGSTEH
jgi:hypothetical protein